MEEPGDRPERDEDLQRILQAYRARKKQALQQATAESPAAGRPASPRVPSPPPRPPAWQPPPMPPAAVPAPPAHAGTPAWTPVSAPASSAPEPQWIVEADPASVPAAVRPPLTALSPVLQLSDRLLADRAVATRGSPVGRAIGFSLLLAGLGGLVLAQRWEYLNEAVLDLPGTTVPADFAMVAVAIVGGFLALLFFLVPGGHHIQVRLAQSQAQEWDRVQAEAKTMRAVATAGAALAVLGLLGLTAAYAILVDYALLGAAALLAVVVLVGIVLVVVARARRGVLHRLYIQTLLLSRLESSGLGAAGGGPDPRVADVLIALDRLLGALPEAAVRQFLASPEAETYLELVDEATRRGGPGAR